MFYCKKCSIVISFIFVPSDCCGLGHVQVGPMRNLALLPCEEFSLRTFIPFPVARRGGVKTESKPHRNEMNTQEVIKEDLKKDTFGTCMGYRTQTNGFEHAVECLARNRL
ncbi:hypothetical protein AVEN_109342-1 [Araneus ventricosus]|uniref:Uncharacterized protein n=1 Tax=Araneus ventricosus TaxID=182803 RepID=A0A4Y2D374_ARAVE|nr:hypothetical protein AVEN_109342-1 [Araneus ventricosus]